MEGSADVVTMADGSARPEDSGFHHGVSNGAIGDTDGASRRDRHRVDMSLLPLKKRALNDKSSSGRYSNNSDKKKRLDHCILGAAERKDAEDSDETHPGSSVPAAAEGDAVSDAEKLRLIKGKWKATGEDSSVDHQPPVKKQKLLHDGIRSGARTNERLLTHDVEAPDPEAILGGAVLAQLARLRATRPRFVHRKRLEKSDVCSNQNRLLVSCKRDSLARCPITRFFSPAEMRRVEDKHVGLLVMALDRDGRKWHTLTCKFLDSNSGYRFISGWSEFLKDNGLVLDGRGMWTRDVDIELWAFRSRELPKQPLLGPDGKLSRGKDGKPVSGLEMDEHLHPDGTLGLLLLHRENRRRRVVRDEDDDGEEPPMPVAHRRGTKKQSTKQRDRNREASTAAAQGETGGGDKRQGETGAAASMSKDEVVRKFGPSVSDAVIGMIGLRDAMLREGRGNVEVGCAT